MSYRTFSAIVIGTFVLVVLALIFYPILFPVPISSVKVEVDSLEGKIWLDSKVTFEIRGNVSKAEIIKSLNIQPRVTITEDNLQVENLAVLPLHEGLPWSKTRVTLNSKKIQLFQPEEFYELSFQGEQLIEFETITVPKVIQSVPAEGSSGVLVTEAVRIDFNSPILWQDEYLVVTPQLDVEITLSEDQKQLVVAPVETPWANSTAYSLTVKKDLPSTYSHKLLEDFVLNFATIGPINTVGSTPTGEHHLIDSQVRVSFDRPPVQSAAELSFQINPSLPGTFNWENENTLVWKSEVPLAYSTVYEISIGGDKSWQDPISSSVWQFRTVDPPVFVSIEGSDKSPTTLRAIASGGTGTTYSFNWTTGANADSVFVELGYDQVEKLGVSVSSGDQTAFAQVVVTGPPSPCPKGWLVVLPTVCYTEQTLEGPVRTYVTRVEIASPDLSIEYALAENRLKSRSTVSSSAVANNMLVAANGDYFDLAGGSNLPIGPVVSDGVVKYLPELSSDVLVLDENGNSWVGEGNTIGLSIHAENLGEYKLSGVNTGVSKEGIFLFNSYFGSQVSFGEGNCFAIFTPSQNDLAVSPQTQCGPNSVALNAGQFVLVGFGSGANWLQTLGSTPISISGNWPLVNPDTVIGGIGILLRDGIAVSSNTVNPGFNPRTAVGVDAQGYLYFIVIDGRSSVSVGMTFAQLQQYLLSLGLRNAINLDGGGSSTLVLQGKLKNQPSEGVERAVASTVGVSSYNKTCSHPMVGC